jgi:FixJ family two-component response regulator
MPERIPVRAVKNGGLDFIEVPTREEAWIAALRRERHGYEVHGNAEGVALVDAELARLGAPVTEPARKKRPRGGSQN